MHYHPDQALTGHHHEYEKGNSCPAAWLGNAISLMDTSWPAAPDTMKTGMTLGNTISKLMQLLILMAMPALLQLLHHYSRRTPVDDLQRWFGLNYLYMTMPHFLILFFAWPGSRSLSFTIKGLLGINLLLGLFSTWVWLCSPPRESGLAWVLYIPVWCLYLAGMIATHYWQKNKKAA